MKLQNKFLFTLLASGLLLFGFAAHAQAPAARSGSAVGRSAASRAPPRDRHRRASDEGAGRVGSSAGAAGGTLGLPVPRPGQGHDAGRAVAAPHRPRATQRQAGARAVRAPESAERLPRAGRAHCARAWPCACQPGPGGRRVAAPAGTLRRTAPPRAFCRAAASLRSDARGRLGFELRAYPQRARLLQALACARSVDTAVVAQCQAALGRSGPQVGQAIQAARVAALRQGFAAST